MGFIALERLVLSERVNITKHLTGPGKNPREYGNLANIWTGVAPAG